MDNGPSNRVILVVDDNDVLRRAVAQSLAAAGHEVREAGDATQARSEARMIGDRLDVLVVDLRLPDGEGEELAHELASLRPHGLRVLAISSDRARLERASQSGLATLAKPFRLKALEARLPTLPLTTTDEAREEVIEEEAPVPPATPRRPPQGFLALVAAVGIAAVAVGFWFRAPAPPPLPRPVDGPARSLPAIELVSPAGPVAEAPAELTWTAFAGATRYVAEIEGAAGERLWEVEVDEPQIAIPDAVRDAFRPMVLHHWRVTALAADGAAIAASSRRDFRVIPSVSGDAEGPR